MSVPSRRLVVGPRARSDVRDILRYTKDRWGDRQREIYKAKLGTAMVRLLAFPSRGRSLTHLSAGLHALTVESHVMYYRFDDETVTVVRVLHGAMDADRQVFS